MYKSIYTSAIIAAATLSVIHAASTKPDKDRSQALSKAHFEFSLNLYRGLANSIDPGEGFVYSPYCINLALSMLFLGTRSASETSNQFRRVLGYEGISYVDVHTAFKSVTENFGQTYYQKKVRSGNAVFVKKGVDVSPTYVRAVREFYHSTIEHKDFAQQGSRVRGELNEWVSEVTEGSEVNLIKKLLPDTSLLLVNALSMHSRWLQPFDPINTFDKGLFYMPDKTRLEVPMMSGVFEVPTGHSSDLECRVLEIPFTQKRMSMFVFLPDDPARGIYKLQDNATAKNVKSLLGTLKTELVTVRLPRFRISSAALNQNSSKLEGALKSLGLREVFSPERADLSLMAPQSPTDSGPRLSLSAIKHSATYQVSESAWQPRRSRPTASGGGSGGGSEGSAHPDDSLLNHHQVFEVDHPFMFLVWDYYSGMILLMGRVLNPMQEDPPPS